MLDVGFANEGNRWQNLRRQFYSGGALHPVVGWSSRTLAGWSVPLQESSPQKSDLSTSLKTSQTDCFTSWRTDGFSPISRSQHIDCLGNRVEFIHALDERLNTPFSLILILATQWTGCCWNYRWSSWQHHLPGLIETSPEPGTWRGVPMNGLSVLEATLDLYRSEYPMIPGKRGILEEIIADEWLALSDVALTPKLPQG